MQTVTVSDKGQVVIPVPTRRRLGIMPGTKLDFELTDGVIRVRVATPVKPTRPEDGYGLLTCTRPGVRHLSDFHVAQAMREKADDRR